MTQSYDNDLLCRLPPPSPPLATVDHEIFVRSYDAAWQIVDPCMQPPSSSPPPPPPANITDLKHLLFSGWLVEDWITKKHIMDGLVVTDQLHG